MNKEEFEKEYPEVAQEIKDVVDTTVYSLEVLYDRLQKSTLPTDIKLEMLKNFKVNKE